MLNNTYHLNIRPGMKVLNDCGGAHKFQGWDRNLLTACAFSSFREVLILTIWQDSGGFQLVSLSKFTTITEEGALFSNPFTGESTMLTVSPSINLKWTDRCIVASQRRAYLFNTLLVRT